MKTPCFTIYGNKIAGWRWRLRAANGEIVAQGEAYTRKSSCLRAVRAIRRLAAQATIK